MLKVVLFDLDNTLLDRDRAFRECVYARFSEPAVRAQLTLLDQGGHGERQALFDFWRHHEGGCMNQAEFGRLLAHRIQPDPDLLEALRTLASRAKLGIITNGSSQIQREKLKAAGLAGVFPPDRVWISAEVGKSKPDPGIFLLACQTLGESPGDCLFIGDQEQDDQAGARAAGMRFRLAKAVLNSERLNALIAEEQA